jgi:hypothetical protein
MDLHPYDTVCHDTTCHDILANPKSTQKHFLVEYHYYISNDNEHDTFFVQHYFELHWAYLTTRGTWPNEQLVWSYGCATQFKSRRAWYHVFR